MISYLKNYVELRTKVASVFPFFYVLAIYLYSFDSYQFSLAKAIIFFISMLALDMATTVLNHLAGMHREDDISFYDQKLLNQMEQLGLTSNFNRIVLFILLIIGIGFGLFLALTSSLLLIVIGGICILVAVAYSYGPIPLKNTFLGEVASGVTMGGLIPLAFIISQDQSIFITNFSLTAVTLNLQSILIWTIALAIPILVIANIMLANNICDMEKDLANGRITLPLIIGRPSSKLLWIGSYLICYCLIIGLVIARVIPVVGLIGLLTLPIVLRNSRKFIRYSVKAETFKYAVFNLQIILLAVTIPTLIGIIIK